MRQSKNGCDGMRVALIKPSNNLYQKNLFYNVSHVCEPLGLSYIGAVAKKAGHTVKIIHQLDSPDDKILKETIDFKPDVVGFSIVTCERKKTLNLAQKLKKTIHPTIIFGGPDVTARQEIVNEFPTAVDFGVVGEGEHSFIEFLNKKDDMWYNIYGLVSYGRKNPPKRITNLDALPFPLREDLPMDKYKTIHLSNIPYSEQRFSAIVASRGCYYNCDFCSNKILWNCEQITRSAENVVDEIKFLIKNYGRNLIFLNDPTPSKRTLEEIATEILKKNIKIRWYSFLCTNEADLSLYQLMHDSGYELGIFGIESGSDKMLAAMHKGTTKEKSIEAVKAAKKAGFFVHGTYMVGYPDESKEEFLESFKFLKTIGLDSVNFYFITPLPGTAFYEHCKQKGLIKTEDPDKYDLMQPVIKTRLEKEIGRKYKKLLFWCQNNFYDEGWVKNMPSRNREPYRQFLNLIKEKRGLQSNLDCL